MSLIGRELPIREGRLKPPEFLPNQRGLDSINAGDTRQQVRIDISRGELW